MLKAALKKSNTTVQAKRKGTNKTFLVRKKKCNQKQSGKATTHPGDQAVTEAHTSLAAADDTQPLAPWSTQAWAVDTLQSVCGKF